jgi:hypothetical protein
VEIGERPEIFVIGHSSHIKYDHICGDWQFIICLQENKILHLNCVNFFGPVKLFGPVKVLPLLDQMSSEIQGTFGMTDVCM